MPLSPVRVPVLVVAFALLIQLPAYAPWKAAEDGSDTWVPAIQLGQPQALEFWASGFSVVHSCLLWALASKLADGWFLFLLLFQISTHLKQINASEGSHAPLLLHHQWMTAQLRVKLIVPAAWLANSKACAGWSCRQKNNNNKNKSSKCTKSHQPGERKAHWDKMQWSWSHQFMLMPSRYTGGQWRQLWCCGYTTFFHWAHKHAKYSLCPWIRRWTVAAFQDLLQCHPPVLQHSSCFLLSP